jgi:DNA-binding response OmpR family regulator
VVGFGRVICIAMVKSIGFGKLSCFGTCAQEYLLISCALAHARRILDKVAVCGWYSGGRAELLAGLECDCQQSWERAMRVLVVEDDRALGAFLRQGMELEGHRVAWAEDGETALVRAAEDHPDLMLLDLSLPRRDGVEVLVELRARREDAAVLVLSGRVDRNVRVQCLDLGADDYLAKPFSFFELRARCRALLRRRVQFADPVLRHGDLELNRIERRVARSGQTINLTAKEFSLLEYLLQHQGECVSRNELLAGVWQMPAETGTNVVDVYVNYLRRKVEGGTVHDAHGGLIETVRGEGYRLGGMGKKPAGRRAGRPAGAVACA